MKFGLYAHPGTSWMIRCIDGVFTLVNYDSINTTNPQKMWQATLALPGRPLDPNIILPKLQNKGLLCTYSRSVATVLYGVPADVELYAPGDFGVRM